MSDQDFEVLVLMATSGNRDKTFHFFALAASDASEKWKKTMLFAGSKGR
jgi:hypothetical protein